MVRVLGFGAIEQDSSAIEGDVTAGLEGERLGGANVDIGGVEREGLGGGEFDGGGLEADEGAGGGEGDGELEIAGGADDVNVRLSGAIAGDDAVSAGQNDLLRVIRHWRHPYPK
jgi:hypothetical protein